MSLHEVWQAASGSPFTPVISKENQLLLGSTLLLVGEYPGSMARSQLTRAGLSLTALFGLSIKAEFQHNQASYLRYTDRALVSLPLLGIPAALAFGYESTSLLCLPSPIG